MNENNIIGYDLGIRDNGQIMFDKSVIVPRCPQCGYRTDFVCHNLYYQPPASKSDLSQTLDGQIIANEKFRAFCEGQRHEEVDFRQFCNSPSLWHVLIRRSVRFDAKRRKTRFIDFCTLCHNYDCIVGATPAYLDEGSPLGDGFYRSDLLFACGDRKAPLVFCGAETKRKLQQAGISGIYFLEAFGATEPVRPGGGRSDQHQG